MSGILACIAYLIGLVLLAAVALKAGELIDRLFKLKGSLLFFFSGVGLLFSGIGWERYLDGKISLLDAVVISLFLGGLPFLVAAWGAISEILFHLTKGIIGKLRGRSNP